MNAIRPGQNRHLKVTPFKPSQNAAADTRDGIFRITGITLREICPETAHGKRPLSAMRADATDPYWQPIMNKLHPDRAGLPFCPS